MKETNSDLTPPHGFSAFAVAPRGDFDAPKVCICMLSKTGEIVNDQILIAEPNYARDLAIYLMDVADRADAQTSDIKPD